MSAQGVTHIVHEAGPVVDGVQRCTRCGEDLPRDIPKMHWTPGSRVAKAGCAGDPAIFIYDIPDAWELDDDEVPCAGSIHVGQRADA